MLVEVIAIMQWLAVNMNKIVKNGVEIVDVIEEPMAHPHYYARNTLEVYFDEEKDCIMSDLGCSGSPSCWNHYTEEVNSYIELAEYIWYKIQNAEEKSNDEKYKVYINQDLYQAIENAIICEKYIFNGDNY